MVRNFALFSKRQRLMWMKERLLSGAGVYISTSHAFLDNASTHLKQVSRSRVHMTGRSVTSGELRRHSRLSSNPHPASLKGTVCKVCPDLIRSKTHICRKRFILDNAVNLHLVKMDRKVNCQLIKTAISLMDTRCPRVFFRMAKYLLKI